MEDKVVVTYGDTTLYESDVALLRPGEWLNDSVISFWFEYLAKERFKDHQDDLLFIDPSAMFMINFSDDMEEVREAMAALELEKRSMILMPINDNASIDHAGGTHWTLLVYTKRDGKFRHYDSFSAQATVCTAAKRTAKVMHAVLGGAGEPLIEAVHTPQQGNGSVGEFLGKLPAGGMPQRIGSNTGAATRAEMKRALDTIITATQQAN
ncbi:Ulp1 protease family, Cterminal catalytic domain containing protein [Acanthamoeba castellanii str. Neff]|uniref:Ulp1 protease family, Cterminal catalytic domain containing protein n=1 Tax=Acanthamoeba castellanii (strain ATCC 30010 / Neff) TaxID=1257118 RepID=L8GZJ7_ACACF|nr:Ulp1 protease family, Cterminal catalytic domain containing protein [Acanthamoeba castellanii str. Neff]ELR17526.1 Ulp1 protease family, Cterminal catalytic domain containing protein [Acanthamoeba castellanii str. Neff]